MVLVNKLAYLHMPKTGGTHIASLLTKELNGVQIGRHNRVPDNLKSKVAFTMGSIRNPWDWYVSLWAYGCAGNGVLYKRLVGLKVDLHSAADRPYQSQLWQKLYSDASNTDNFRMWLAMIHHPRTAEELGEGYAESRVAQWAGFMTYRYCALYLPDIKEISKTALFIHSQLTLHGNPNFVIKTETLASDLIRALEICGMPLSESQATAFRLASRTNSSDRMKTCAYYDQESVEMVGRRDSLMIDIGGYASPSS